MRTRHKIGFPLILVLVSAFVLCPDVLARSAKIAVFLGSGRGDLSFNDMGYKGAAAAAADFGIQLVTVQGTGASDFLPTLRDLARTCEYDAIITFGQLLQDAVIETANAFPNQRFVTIGGVVSDMENVLSIVFREREMSALIGALAGMAAAHHGCPYVGIVLGIEIPTLYHFEAGFRFGIDWGLERYRRNTGDDVRLGLLYTYTGTFRDIAVGKAATEAMLAQGAVGVYNVAGALGLGEHEAIADFHEMAATAAGPPYYFGVDANQDYFGEGRHALASGMKRVDEATYAAIRSVVEGTFAGGLTSLGLADGGVGISGLDDLVEFIEFGIEAGAIASDGFYRIVGNWAKNRATVPAWIWDAIDELRVGILEGSILVPTANSSEEIRAVRAAYPLFGSNP